MEHESCQPKDMEVNTDEGMEKLSFIPSAVSDSAGGANLSRPSTCATKSATKRASASITSQRLAERSE